MYVYTYIYIYIYIYHKTNKVNVVDYGSGGKPFGKICMDTYFEVRALTKNKLN